MGAWKAKRSMGQAGTAGKPHRLNQDRVSFHSPLQSQVMEGIVQHRAVLVIVDSIAALARGGDFGSGVGAGRGGHQAMMDRQEALGMVRVV